MCNGGGIVNEIFDLNVCMSCCGRKGEEDCKKCVLQQDGLPELAPHLLFEDGGVRTNDIRVAVQTHSVCLPDQNPSERPAVRSMVVVDEKVGDEDHGLDGTDGWIVRVGGHSQSLVSGGNVEFGCLLALFW